MSSTLAYRGFSARVDFDAEDGLLVGRLAGINDVVGFHAEAVDDYVETCPGQAK